MKEKAIYWFRNNLRLRDNPLLVKAIAETKALLPVYVIDKTLREHHAAGFRNCGPYRWKFLIESLLDLRKNLQSAGSDLFILYGDPVKEILSVAQTYQIGDIYTTKELDYIELKQEKIIGAKLQLHLDFDQLLIDPGTLPFAVQDLPMTFSDFRHAIEKNLTVRSEIPPPAAIPTLPFHPLSPDEVTIPATPVDHRSAIPFQGGEAQAWKRTDHYFWTTGKLTFYKNTRNGLTGTDYSSKFSPYMALGCISPVSIFHEVKRFESTKVKNDSTYWLIFEVFWREFFKLTSWKFGNKIFRANGLLERQRVFDQNTDLFHQWMHGKTADGFVNANMIELKQTGFMSNRGRQNAASYLVHDMNIDWRWGAAWFESQLIDYDCASNWCNWMYVAGVGNDPENRKFNTQLQAEKYDPSGKYRRLWLQPPGRKVIKQD